MSDDWFYGGRQRRSGSWLPLIMAVLILANVLVLAYTTAQSNGQLREMNGRLSAVSSSVQTLNTQLTAANAEISRLRGIIQGGGAQGNYTLLIDDLVSLYNKTKDSVVLIKVMLAAGGAEGSGFVYDLAGMIVTNNHVVEGALNGSITVTFIDGTILKAKPVGNDPYSDIAVIRVDAPEGLLKPLRLGVSSDLKVGEPVIAIGNPYGLADTLTSGIVSAVGRQMDSEGRYPIVDVIQTDAAINPGNSGGPLLNMAGEVVGINTAIPTETSRGIGFAVPSDTITREILSLITTGTYKHPYLGITGVDVTPGIVEAMSLLAGTRGTLVVEVNSSGPAAHAGIRGGQGSEVTIEGSPIKIGGDVITGADGTPMKNFYDLILYIQRNKSPGKAVTLSILRDNVLSNIVIKLGERPAP